MRWLATLSLFLLATTAVATENDLSVAWIARLPRIDYVWNSANPTVEGWPAAGSTVTWVANVRWLGSEPRRGVSYCWTIDGVAVRKGTLDFGPESLVTAELPWTWTFVRHEIGFEIDNMRLVAETEERNNRLVVYSNALGVGIYVERTYWTTVSPKFKSAGIGVTTFDDWIQKQVRRFNEIAANAFYPETPNGVLDRWRVDAIHVVEDGALPLAPPLAEARDWGADPGGYGTLYPNVLDHTVDMQWGFPATTAGFWPEYTPWILMMGNSYVHEWSHARTMIDTYAWDLTPSADFVNLDPAPPVESYAYYNTPEQGLMHFDWGHVDRFTAVAMNRMAGRRALRGNYNEPWDLGWFLNDFAEQNRVRLVRGDGTPIRNSQVLLYRSTAEDVDWKNGKGYGMVFNNTPAQTLTTDSEGRILVGKNPFADGRIYAFVEKANGICILRIQDGATRRWAYLDSLQFNLAYWRGQTQLADIEVMAGAPMCRDALGPGNIGPAPEALVTTPVVHFRIPVTREIPYDLYYSANGAPPVKIAVPARAATETADIPLTPPAGRIVWWFIEGISSPPCPPQHSSVYAFDHDVPRPWKPVSH